MKLPVVLVLGCVRSGTSCLAGILAEQGIPVGPVDRTPKPGLVPTGAFEDPEVSRFHHASFDWYSPPPFFRWSESHDARLSVVLKRYPRMTEPVLLKDPKMLIVLNGWLRHVEPRSIIGTFRHPQGVWNSMQRRLQQNPHYPYRSQQARAGRDPMTSDWSYSLWERYNLELYRFQKMKRFPIVNLDSPTYLADVGRACAAEGLPFDETHVQTFQDKYRNEPDGGCPAPLEGLYQRLCEIAQEVL